MFNGNCYVPILKWKRGEQKALEYLADNVQKHIIPLIEIVPIPYDYVNDCQQKSIDEHLKNVAEQISNSWRQDKPVFLDTYLVEGEVMEDESDPLSFIANDAHSRNIKIIPVTGFSRNEKHQNAVKSILERDKVGICLRIEDEDLINLNDNIINLLKIFNIDPSQVDLLIDFKYISPNDEKKNIITIHTIINSLPLLNDWRNLIFAASSFPENMSVVKSNSIDTILRSEWSIWKSLLKNRNKIKRMPTFSDYTISNPIWTEIDPRIMQMSANIRYTAEDEWIIFKGYSTKRSKGFNQFYDLAKSVIEHEKFCGKDFSWGDEYIYKCAKGQTGPGSAETWRRVGTNHHISFIINQFSSFSLI